MTDTPYTLTTMTLADAMAAWKEVACSNPTPGSVECYKAAREALITHLRAAQAVPEDELTMRELHEQIGRLQGALFRRVVGDQTQGITLQTLASGAKT